MNPCHGPPVRQPSTVKSAHVLSSRIRVHGEDHPRQVCNAFVVCILCRLTQLPWNEPSRVSRQLGTESTTSTAQAGATAIRIARRSRNETTEHDPHDPLDPEGRCHSFGREERSHTMMWLMRTNQGALIPSTRHHHCIWTAPTASRWTSR